MKNYITLSVKDGKDDSVHLYRITNIEDDKTELSKDDIIARFTQAAMDWVRDPYATENLPRLEMGHLTPFNVSDIPAIPERYLAKYGIVPLKDRVIADIHVTDDVLFMYPLTKQESETSAVPDFENDCVGRMLHTIKTVILEPLLQYLSKQTVPLEFTEAMKSLMKDIREFKLAEANNQLRAMSDHKNNLELYYLNGDMDHSPDVELILAYASTSLNGALILLESAVVNLCYQLMGQKWLMDDTKTYVAVARVSSCFERVLSTGTQFDLDYRYKEAEPFVRRVIQQSTDNESGHWTDEAIEWVDYLRRYFVMLGYQANPEN